jgi:response regulator of citrate/malate metabolism
MGVNLNYSSGNGLLVNDVSSDVGTGWNLDAGGFIARAQNGEPDDQQEYIASGFSADKDNEAAVKMVLKNYPNGYLFNPFTTSGCNAGLNYYPVFTKQKVYKELNHVLSDMEQDKFFFRMNGRSGAFVIGKNLQVTTLGDSRVKISFSMTDMTAQGIRTRINQFVITTEDGIKYTFSQKVLTHICRYKYSGRR